jgi:integrase
MAKRGVLSMDSEGSSFVVRFGHPFLRSLANPERPKIVRINLGVERSAALDKLAQLNQIFIDPRLWHALPAGTPEWLRKAWGDDGGSRPLSAPEVAGVESMQATVDMLLGELAAERAARARDRAAFDEALAVRDRELEEWRGRAYASGPDVTLDTARADWLARYQGRDKHHTDAVRWDLERFCKKFGGDTSLKEMCGCERDIDAWLRGLTVEKDQVVRPIGAGRRQQIRRVVLRFLQDSGLRVDVKAVGSVGTHEVRRDRGEIRWLERAQAVALADAFDSPAFLELDRHGKPLPADVLKTPDQLAPRVMWARYWSDAFRVQVALGLRPSELPTLQAGNFSSDFSELTLATLGALSLKNGSRHLRVPRQAREIIERRAGENAIVFANKRGKAWATAEAFCKKFHRALQVAAQLAGIATAVDCRTGRRTCASLLLRAGKTVEDVAAILGDDPDTIREHYARILSHEVDPSAAAL